MRLVQHALLFLAVATCPLAAQDTPAGNIETAPVTIDGVRLFELRGVTAYPAKQRADLIRGRIVEFARNKDLDPENMVISNLPERTVILAGETLMIQLFDADGQMEGVDRQVLAEVLRNRIKNAIIEYRAARTPDSLLRNSGVAAGVTVVMLVLWWVFLRLFRWLDSWASRHVQGNIEVLASKSHQLIHAGHLWTIAAGLLKALRFVIFALLTYSYLNTVLGLYPWTRPVALALFRLVTDPLASMWHGLLSSIPDLAFLAILFFIVRYVLGLTHGFFLGISSGRIRLKNFDPDWAEPTLRIVRVLIIAFAIVIAYPYIPGSDSAAFKGVSLFLGVIVSLGSSSVVANAMAGLTMTYRNVFKQGDVVRIGDVVGTVMETKNMVTRIRTPKNEAVILPNSSILNANVVNYSLLAREQGLTLHTEIGIGYDTPWRQVEAMLLEAARRTVGLQEEPAPFVLQKSLGDFAVIYELNAYCNSPAKMPALYSAMHANIQDVFNEYGVQIMSPAYKADPASPKIVPREHWFDAPAKPSGD